MGWVRPMVNVHTPVDSPKPLDIWTSQIELCMLLKKKISRHNIWWGSRLEMLWKGKLGDIYILLYMHIFEIPKEKIMKNKIKSIKRKNRRKEGKKWKERPYNMISLNINRFINMVGHACLILNLCSFSNVTSTRYRRNYYNNITNKS